MSAQPIGIVAEQTAKREGAVAHLSPAAKHRNFPKLYAQPIPRATDDVQQKATIARLQEEKAKAARVNAELRAIIAALRVQLEETTALAAMAIASPAVMHRHAPKDVIAAFLSSLNAVRAAQGAAPCTVDDLHSPRRSRPYTAPRHVCIWLVRQLCTHYSLPMIGKIFGRRDHTTTMHACKRAAFWMLIDPDLKAAADSVLASFAAKGETP